MVHPIMIMAMTRDQHAHHNTTAEKIALNADPNLSESPSALTA